jgi:hypothetical protein
MDRGRANPNQHLIVRDTRLIDLAQLNTSDEPYLSWTIAFIGSPSPSQLH